jgi:hypothetical protein
LGHSKVDSGFKRGKGKEGKNGIIGESAKINVSEDFNMGNSLEAKCVPSIRGKSEDKVVFVAVWSGIRNSIT